MCEYSLHDVASRPAMISDQLVTTEFGSTRGFAAVGEHGVNLVTHDSPPKVAVCLLPGTELDCPQRGAQPFGRIEQVIPPLEGSQAAA